MEPTEIITQFQNPKKKEARDLLKNLLFPTTGNSNGAETSTDTNGKVLGDFLTSFNRYVATQETAFDNGAPASTSKTSSTSQLERQIERALHQVLGKSPGRNPESFVKALDEAFPSSGNSKAVALTPVRSVVSLYSPETNGDSAGNLVGQIPTQQASLYRQASVVAADAVKVLAGLETFVPSADREPVEALRSLLQAQIRSLVDEFGRINNPRSERVEVYLDNLDTQLREFGKKAQIDNLQLATTVEDEASTTGFLLLGNYIATLTTIWERYLSQIAPSLAMPQRSLSDRLSRANILLPVIAQANIDFEQALDSIGFSESERISEASRFSNMAMFELNPNTNPNDDLADYLPNITIYDLNEWVDRFATLESPAMLSQSGYYGLNFVAEQADKLFWTVGGVIAYVKSSKPLAPGQVSPLEQLLSSERVIQAMNNLFIQLDALADLAS